MCVIGPCQPLRRISHRDVSHVTQDACSIQIQLAIHPHQTSLSNSMPRTPASSPQTPVCSACLQEYCPAWHHSVHCNSWVEYRGTGSWWRSSVVEEAASSVRQAWSGSLPGWGSGWCQRYARAPHQCWLGWHLDSPRSMLECLGMARLRSEGRGDLRGGSGHRRLFTI